MSRAAARPAPLLDHEPRVELVVRIEWALLVLRYAALVTVALLHGLGLDQGYYPSIWLTLGGVAAHNAFAHWVLYTGRHKLFFSPLNFLIYLTDITLIVALIGDARGPFAVLYTLFIVGYCLYAPRFQSLYLVTLLCCIAYVCTFIFRFSRFGEELDIAPVMLDLLGIFLCGWLISTLGLLLQRIEQRARSHERELSSSEATLRTIFDSTAEPVLVCDENEMIVDLNHQACEFFGAAREKILARRLRHLLFDDGTLPEKMATLRTRGEFRGEVIVVLNNGEERDADLLARSFIRNERRYFVVMIHDITGHKNLQEASRLANQALADANRELQRVSSMRVEFAERTSMYLRSPLAALIGYMDLLLDESLGELTPEQRKAVHSSHRTAYRVLDHIDQAFKSGEEAPAPEARDEQNETPLLDSSHSVP